MALALKKSEHGYGWSLTIGKRIRAYSAGGTTRMRPHISKTFDENCNEGIMLHCWPLGQIIVFYKPWRTEPCQDCEEDE